MPQLIDVSHATKRGSSLGITIPKKVQEKLGIKGEEIVGFYEDNGKIILEEDRLDFVKGHNDKLYYSYFQSVMASFWCIHEGTLN